MTVASDVVAASAERPPLRIPWITRLCIAAAGLLLIGATRLPWFSVDVAALQIRDVQLLGAQVSRALIGYRIESDQMIIALLGLLIAVTAGAWSWRVGLLLARPLLLLFSGLVVVWSTLAFVEAGSVPSLSSATQGMTASVGPAACGLLGLGVFGASVFARLSASDLPAGLSTIDGMLRRGRAPVAATFSRRLVNAVQRGRGAGHSDTMRAALTHAQCLLAAGFPDLAGAVLARVESRAELTADPDATAYARALRADLAV